MSSGVEITATIAVPRDRLGNRNTFTPYPYSQPFINVNEADDGEILPYMARAHSPIRVTFTPATRPVARKSRVTDTAKSATFNYKPLRRGDLSASLRFRAPDATMTTLQNISPWMSITKSDFLDPRMVDSDSGNCAVTPGLFSRTFSDGSIEITRRITPAISRSEYRRIPETIYRDCSTVGDITRESSAKTVSSEKRVKITIPTAENDLEHVKNSLVSTSVVNCRAPSKANLKALKEPENGVNYYSGYLPPEYSDRIAEQLNIDTYTSEDSDKRGCRSHLPTQFYKPLVGDRTLYMHGSYPTQPKIMQSDIDQLRLEGRKRLLQTHGQAPVHFSAFKDRGTLARPKQKGAHLDEAVRAQHRQTQSAKSNRVPGQTTSLEVFQQQRERTYHLQNLAREMINK